MKIEIKDHIEVDALEGSSIVQILKSADYPLLKQVLAAYFNDTLIDLGFKPQSDGIIIPVTFNDDEGKKIYWHTASHVLAQAVKTLFPETKLAIGPAISDGFYYDFDRDTPFTEADLESIEKQAKRIIKDNLKIEHFELNREDSLAFERERDEGYKIELINDIEGDSFSFYKQGEFVDLCRGPHLQGTGLLKSFKVLSLAGAYWRGDERNKMLQRIYGIAFPASELLEEYLKKLEEIKKRDHRVLGKQLDLFSFHEEAGAGLPLFHPKGAKLRRIIEEFWINTHEERGYEVVWTPHLYRSDLWKRSGHYDYFLENMYRFDIDDTEYVIKPMNCPGHILIYKSSLHSYRDLPVRYAELGTVYRYEKSGALHGLLRVRCITQDDAHIFCRPDQAKDEVRGVVELAIYMLEKFGFNDYKIELSLHDPNSLKNYSGREEDWDMAEQALRDVLKEMDLPFKEVKGEAAFYGPKIDIKLIDAMGSLWQGPTTQFDFNLPERFDVTYRDNRGKEQRVVMIHRTVLGAIERFIGNLIEHYAGAFPFWLSPEQIRILTITEEFVEYGEGVYAFLKRNGYRIDKDFRNEKLGFKIREAIMQKIPYILIIGQKEQEKGLVSVRGYKEGDMGQLGLEDFNNMLKSL